MLWDKFWNTITMVIGLFGLTDPVFNLKSRDEWIGWDKDTKRLNLRNVMDAFIVGSIPPYSQLLCGKLICLLMTSSEVREYGKKIRKLEWWKNKTMKLAIVWAVFDDIPQSYVNFYEEHSIEEL